MRREIEDVTGRDVAIGAAYADGRAMRERLGRGVNVLKLLER